MGVACPLLGRHDGWVAPHDEVLASLFSRDGWSVRATSPFVNPLLRTSDAVWCTARWRSKLDVLVLSVYSGKAFAVVDAVSYVANRLGVPLVMVLHGGGLPDFAQRHPAWATRVLTRAARIVAPSSFQFESLAWTGLDIRQIPNVLDLDAYDFRVRSPVSPRLLWMRTFHPLYDPLLALDVFAELRRRFGGASLTMAGQDKGMLGAAREHAASLGVADAIEFPGYLSAEGKRRAFNSHDVYLHTSLVDNMPVSALEAMASGLPVVATSVGGLPHMIDDGDTGVLVPPQDAASYTDALTGLLRSPDLARRLSTNGRKVAERSGWPAVKQQWLDLFNELRS